MNYAIIFLSLGVIFVSCMLIINIQIIFAPLENKLIIKVWLFRIKILTIKVSIVGFYYQINNSKKLKSFNPILNKEQEYLLFQIKNSILDKLYYDDINIKTYIGLNDAKNTAICIGLLNEVMFLISNKLYLKKVDTRLLYENTYIFTYLEFKCILDFKVYFTIFDLVFAIISSFYKRNRYVKERKKVE